MCPTTGPYPEPPLGPVLQVDNEEQPRRVARVTKRTRSYGGRQNERTSAHGDVWGKREGRRGSVEPSLRWHRRKMPAGIPKDFFGLCQACDCTTSLHRSDWGLILDLITRYRMFQSIKVIERIWSGSHFLGNLKKNIIINFIPNSRYLMILISRDFSRINVHLPPRGSALMDDEPRCDTLNVPNETWLENE